MHACAHMCCPPPTHTHVHTSHKRQPAPARSPAAPVLRHSSSQTESRMVRVRNSVALGTLKSTVPSFSGTLPLLTELHSLISTLLSCPGQPWFHFPSQNSGALGATRKCCPAVVAFLWWLLSVSTVPLGSSIPQCVSEFPFLSRLLHWVERQMWQEDVLLSCPPTLGCIPRLCVQ